MKIMKMICGFFISQFSNKSSAFTPYLSDAKDLSSDGAQQHFPSILHVRHLRIRQLELPKDVPCVCRADSEANQQDNSGYHTNSGQNRG